MTLPVVGLAMVLLPSALVADDAPVDGRVPVTSLQPEAAPTPLPDERSATDDDDVAGLDGVVIGALQLAGACAVYTVATPAIFVTTSLCPFTACAACAVPTAAAYAATWIGDRFGKMRAPAIWPMAASYAVLMIGGAGLAAAYFGAMSGNSWMGVGGGLAMLAGVVGSAVAIPVAYALAAEEKRPGDDGGGMPGVLTAAHPPSRVRRPARRPADAPPAPQRHDPSAPLPELPLPPMLEPQGALRFMRF